MRLEKSLEIGQLWNIENIKKELYETIYKKQPIYLQRKSVEWFLYDGNIGLW